MQDNRNTGPSPAVETTAFPDGVRCHANRWLPEANTPPVALLIALHGFAEHIGRYGHVWPMFAKSGIEVFAYDQRGAGLSGPKHGDTTLRQNMDDLRHMIRGERAKLNDRGLKNTPIWLYGHSMGGGVILSLLTRPARDGGADEWLAAQIQGVVCAAPFILRTKPPSSWLLWIAPYLLWLVPNLPFNKSINPGNLTSDSEMAKSYEEDPLHDGHVYLKMVLDPMLAGYEILDRNSGNWPSHVKILITHGENDPSTSGKASEKYIRRIQATNK